MLTKREKMKKILSCIMVNQLLFDTDFFTNDDGSICVVIWSHIHQIDKEIKTIKKRINEYNLTKYIIVKKLNRKIGSNYESLSLSFSNQAFDMLDELYTFCILRGLLND